jgi:YD repeat-containing protein
MHILYYLRNTFFTCCCLLGAVSVGTAQTPSVSPYSSVPIASPTAASLGKFTDIPVSYHTGIPEISVPIYAIKEGPLTLPIGLSYHAAGVKVQEAASWVGLGWALNAGGVITRTIVGAPDESGTTNAMRGHFSDYGYSNYLMVGAVVGNSSTMRPGPNDAAIANAFYDGEPDLFFFNFNGYSGKFFFSDDRTPIIVDGQDLKIEYYYPRESHPSASSSLADNNIQGFIITVPTGDKYYFGITDSQPYDGINHVGDKPVEMTYTNYGDSPGVDNNVYSSYYLSKIVAADGIHTIKLSYQREQYSYYTLLTNPVPSAKIVDPHLAGDPYANLDPVSVSLAKENIDGVRLTKIDFSTGSVAFNAATTARGDLGSYLLGGLADIKNTEARALDNIQISAPNFCKQFAFTYSYFGGDNTKLAAGLLTPDGSSIETDKTRLKLESVLEKSCDGTLSTSPWKFEYNGTFLPRRLSYAQDHWGFYNGALNNNLLNTLIPTYDFGSPGSEVPGANRDPAWPEMSMGILTKVTYPTGGTATYKYEPNDVWTKRQKYDYQEVTSACVGSYCGQQSPVQLTIPFSGNFYKFTLDYTRNLNDRYNGSAQFSGVGLPLGLSVGENPSVYRLHDENVQRPAKGTVVCQLYADIGTGSGEGATVRIYEYLLQTITNNAFAGGLRIKTTTAQESAQDPGLITSYSYQEATGHSSGTLFTRPRYVQVVRNDLLGQLGFSADGSTATYNLTPHGCLGPETPNNRQAFLKSPCSILPMSTTQGNHIGYSRVTVSRTGNGRTEYRYYCSDDQDLDTSKDLGKQYDDVCYRTINPGICDPAIPNLPAPPARFEFNRGQLATELIYNEQNQLIKQQQYSYQYDSSRIVTPGYLSKYVAGALLGGTYERKGYWKKQTSVVETTYSSTGLPFTKKQVAYNESPYHHQLTRQSETTTSGQVLETRYQYALDLSVPACNSIDNGTAAYDQTCRTCDAAYANAYSACGTMGCKFDAYIAHVVCRVNARKAYVTYRRANFTDPTNTYRTAHEQAKNNADSQLKPLLQLQDAYHNEKVEISQWRNNQLLSATYTSFGPGLNQPTIIYPAQQFGLFLAAPAANFTSAVVMGNTVSRDGRYANTPDLTLTFDQGALAQVVSRTAPVASYVWGYNNTLPLVKATGVRYSTLSAAYRGAGGNLVALQKDPSLSHALLATYSYRPLVGMTSQTDPTGRTTTYEYDALGRLIRTRDEQNRILSQQQYHYAGK